MDLIRKLIFVAAILISAVIMSGCTEYTQQTLFDQTCEIDSLNGRYFGGDGSCDPNRVYTVKYTVTSNVPVDVYAVPSRASLDSWGSGKSMRFYPQGSYKDVYSVSDCVKMDSQGGVMVINNNLLSDARVHIKVSYSIL